MIRSLKRAVCGATIFAASTVTAFAQSGGSAPDWSGPYGGATLGYVIVDIDGELTFPGTTFLPTSFSTETGSLVASGHAGYTFQMNNFVLGAEADIAYPFDGEVAARPGAVPGFDFGLHGHVRGRAGYLIQPDVLVYGALGLAIADVEATLVPAAGTPITTHSEVLFGLSAGAGLEFVPVEKLRVRFEYLWDHYFDQRFADSVPVNRIIFPALDAQLDTHTVRVGITYYFN